MAQKDMAEKTLADLMNVFLFGGRRMVSPGDLADTRERSRYKADGRLHEMERDVSKLVRDGRKVTVVFAGVEHQSAADRLMPLRVMAYDAQSYRSQLLDKGRGRVRPVVTMVLYFGLERWPYGKRLRDALEVPEGWDPFVSDYEMRNLFEVAFLSPEQVESFRSDFRYVADYFVQMRLTGDYRPRPEVVEHVDAVLKLLSVLTGDDRFEQALDDLPREGGASMCEFLDRVEHKGLEKGLAQGKSEGRSEEKLSVARNMIKERMSDATIVRITGLDAGRVRELRKEAALA